MVCVVFAPNRLSGMLVKTETNITQVTEITDAWRSLTMNIANLQLGIYYHNMTKYNISQELKYVT